MLPPFLLAASAQTLPAVRRFDDWFVGCDNGRTCTAGALAPEALEQGATMTLRRAGEGRARADIHILLPQNSPAAHDYAVDGAQLALHPTRSDDWLQLSSDDADRLVRAIRHGQMLRIRDAKGTTIAQVSLAGATAALLAVDDAQRRIGTVTALVRRGPAPATAVPAPPPLPRVAAVRSGGAAKVTLTPKRIADARREADCEGPIAGADAYRLDRAHSLVLIGCQGGAYNFTSLALVVDWAGHATDAVVAPVEGSENTDGLVTNGGFRNGVLTTSVKSRGPGDCGHSERYVWTGSSFAPIEAARQDTCGGNPDWPILYRATPVWRQE